MGRGSYTAADWTKLKNEKGLVRNQNSENIFLNQKTSGALDCKNIQQRESRDSEELQHSVPIIIGFDVTGSMGYLAKELAVHGIHEVITALLKQEEFAHPQLMCSAIGDCKSDVTPLQVTQFEADIRIVEQLLQLYLEGGGGGNNAESYNLLWYFAARHTVHDHYEKRKKRGFLFTIGDDACHQGISEAEIFRVFGERICYGISNEELLTEVQKKYHVVHIHIEKNTIADQEIFAQWCRLMPGQCTVIDVKEMEYLPDLITAIIAILSGKDANHVMKAMEQQRAEKIARAVAMIQMKENRKNNISF